MINANTIALHASTFGMAAEQALDALQTKLLEQVGECLNDNHQAFVFAFVDDLEEALAEESWTISFRKSPITKGRITDLIFVVNKDGVQFELYIKAVDDHIAKFDRGNQQLSSDLFDLLPTFKAPMTDDHPSPRREGCNLVVCTLSQKSEDVGVSEKMDSYVDNLSTDELHAVILKRWLGGDESWVENVLVNRLSVESFANYYDYLLGEVKPEEESDGLQCRTLDDIKQVLSWIKIQAKRRRKAGKI